MTIKLDIQFIDENVYWCLHTMSDPPFFILFRIKPILQKSILLAMFDSAK